MTDNSQPASADTPIATKKRRAWLAALLSLLAPGLGQIYNTEYRRGFVLLAIGVAIMLAMRASLTVPPITLFNIAIIVAPTLTYFVFCFAAIVDAVFSARRNREAQMGRLNRGYVYLAVVVTWFGSSALLGGLDRSNFANRSYNIVAGSNIPTLLVGDRLFSWNNYHRNRAPRRGEIIVFKLPTDNTRDFVKRIIGLPGDRIRLRNGRLHINGTVVPRRRIEDYAHKPRHLAVPLTVVRYIETLPEGAAYSIIEARGDSGHLDNTPEFVVPNGHYFTLGDHRDNSLDSRMSSVGFVPHQNLRGLPTFIFWSRDKDRIGTYVQPFEW